MKASDFPKFLRRTIYFGLSIIPSHFPLHTSFTEGWALYSEYLGNELGLFEDPYDRLGFYSWNLLRGVRLVIDTGMHVMGWSRQKALDYILNNTAMSETAAISQVDRYITWPGQATAYKIGERAIKGLRRKLEKSERFDLKLFHEDILQVHSSNVSTKVDSTS